MARNAWKFVAVALLAVGAIATAAPIEDAPDPAAKESRPASAEQICTDAKIGETLGGDPNGCREYLDACIEELTPPQRAEWRRSVDACLADRNTVLYRCYAQVPWC